MGTPSPQTIPGTVIIQSKHALPTSLIWLEIPLIPFIHSDLLTLDTYKSSINCPSRELLYNNTLVHPGVVIWQLPGPSKHLSCIDDGRAACCDVELLLVVTMINEVPLKAAWIQWRSLQRNCPYALIGSWIHMQLFVYNWDSLTTKWISFKSISVSCLLQTIDG